MQFERKKKGSFDTLLIVDDDEINREILHNLFLRSFRVEEAENGEQALNKILADPDRYCAVLLDVVMPGMDGLEVLCRLLAHDLLKKIPVFLITAESGSDVMKTAYQMGAMDVIGKPIIPYLVIRRVNSVVELFQARRNLGNKVEKQQSEILEQAKEIIQLNEGMIEALATAIEFRSNESGEHVRRIHDITKYMLLNTSMGDGLEENEIDSIALASFMHDVGKIAIPDAILNKPGKLTPEEFAVMKTHTVQGAMLLEKIPQLKKNRAYQYAYDIALHHHERWDGSGYPDHLKGEQITPWSQVVSLADVYDALSCKRVYKEAFSRDKVLQMIGEGQCGCFNPKLLQEFFSVEKELSKLYDSQEKN